MKLKFQSNYQRQIDLQNQYLKDLKSKSKQTILMSPSSIIESEVSDGCEVKSDDDSVLERSFQQQIQLLEN